MNRVERLKQSGIHSNKRGKFVIRIHKQIRMYSSREPFEMRKPPGLWTNQRLGFRIGTGAEGPDAEVVHVPKRTKTITLT